MVDATEIRQAIEYYHDQGWTDGLPVVPATESFVREFLDRTGRDPDEVVLSMPHLNRDCTVRLAAINAALAGCLPEYFPVVLAAWDSLAAEGYATRGIWQSTTGTAPLLLVNGPVRDEVGLNSKGNVFGSGLLADQLALDIADTVSRTGALIHETVSALVVLGPEHAHVFAEAGWTKSDVRQYVYDHAVVTRERLAAVCKDAVSDRTRWRLPGDHPEAMPDTAATSEHPAVVHTLTSPEAVLVAVAGANNAGVSAVIETFGP